MRFLDFLFDHTGKVPILQGWIADLDLAIDHKRAKTNEVRKARAIEAAVALRRELIHIGADNLVDDFIVIEFFDGIVKEYKVCQLSKVRILGPLAKIVWPQEREIL